MPLLLRRLFGKKRLAETITFLPAVAPEDRAPAAAAIEGGHYLLFSPDADGHAILLLNTSPKLIASISREVSPCGRAGMVVAWLCAASADHRDHLTAGDFTASRAAMPPLCERTPFALET
jgi:hypothetical protein